MKKLCIKFLIFLSLISTKVFADIDNWGNINAHFNFPQTQDDITTLATDIEEVIAYNRSVGHGIYEDIISFDVKPNVNQTFTDDDYQKIAEQTLASAPNIQYILFDVTALNNEELNQFVPNMFKVQNYFVNALQTMKIGIRIKYSKDKTLNETILNIFKKSPQKYSEIDFDGEWADFIKDASLNPTVWENISKVDFIGAGTISIDDTNMATFIKLLNHLKNLKGIDLTSALLKDCICANPEENKKQLIAQLTNALKQHPKISFLNIAANNLDEYAAKQFAEVIQNLDNLILIHVGNNNFGGQGAHQFLQSLVKHKYLSFIDISSNNFTADHADDYVKVISGKSYIAYLNVSYNYFAIEGSYKIRVAMSHPLLLQSLQISKERKNYDIYKSSDVESHLNYKWSGLFFDDFGENYFVSEQQPNVFYKFANTFEYLYLDSNNLYLSPFQDLANSLIATNLKYIDLSSNNLSSAHINDVVRILYFSPKLIGVNLENNAFLGADMEKVANALTSFPVLKYASLSNNKFNKNAIVILAKYLAKDRGLKRLYLSNVELGNGAALELFSSLNAQKNLEVLDISFNDIDKSGVEALLKSLKDKTKFNTLRLIGNKFDCDDLKELSETYIFRCE